MSTITIVFHYHYHKLDQREFTTIRGRAQFRRLKVGDRVTCECRGVTFEAIIKSLELKQVRDLPLALLKADAEYPGFVINCTEDFVNLLNSFRAPFWTQVTMDSELTVISLQKIDQPAEDLGDNNPPCPECSANNGQHYMTCSQRES